MVKVGRARGAQKHPHGRSFGTVPGCTNSAGKPVAMGFAFGRGTPPPVNRDPPSTTSSPDHARGHDHHCAPKLATRSAGRQIGACGGAPRWQALSWWTVWTVTPTPSQHEIFAFVRQTWRSSCHAGGGVVVAGSEDQRPEPLLSPTNLAKSVAGGKLVTTLTTAPSYIPEAQHRVHEPDPWPEPGNSSSSRAARSQWAVDRPWRRVLGWGLPIITSGMLGVALRGRRWGPSLSGEAGRLASRERQLAAAGEAQPARLEQFSGMRW